MFFAEAGWVTAQVAPKADDVVGTWELVSTKNLKTAAVVPSTGASWIQFTRSHWTVLSMTAGRKVIPTAEFDKLSSDSKVKTNYARIWNEKNDQIFAARGGTYRLVGDKLHHPATIAIYTNIIGVDRVLKITRLDKTTLVAQTEYPDDPTVNNELTYRRID
ncbi:MAG: hypothetical protein Q7J25_13515 [Vicinamibacterales bacterium]|nr:hypothetical protein [Vicinamibacterales bacterium]